MAGLIILLQCILGEDLLWAILSIEKKCPNFVKNLFGAFFFLCFSEMFIEVL